MNYMNNATLIRRELITRLAKLFFQDNLREIDRIPLEMAPKKGADLRFRCCIHKERAILKYRLMALLGLSMENEEDELKRLSEYAREERDLKSGDPVITVIDEACSSCVKINYFITNACQGCVARPCTLTCRKDAIEIKNGKAEIDHDKCVNCGLCKDKCPYHAIIHMPVPCEEACPVGAISRNSDNREEIDFDKCIYCGKCMRECPFGAVMERSQLMNILKCLKSDQKVVAMIAPAIIGQFSAEPEQVFAAVKNLGFDEVAEVAYGAEITTEHESHEFIEKMEEGAPFMTTSCCPAYTEAVKKHILGLEGYVSTTPTPMHYTAGHVSETFPGAVRVFVGPCVAKKREALDDPHVDYILSIEELGALFVAKGIDVQKCEPQPATLTGKSTGRGFPVSGGVTNAVKERVGEKMEVSGVTINGLSKKSLKELKKFEKKCPGNFVEVMACEGGCIAGPNVISNPRIAEKSLKKYLGN